MGKNKTPKGKELFKAMLMALLAFSTLVSITGCSFGKSALVGKWAGGNNSNNFPDNLELLKDGRGIIDSSGGITWTVEGDRLYIFGNGGSARAYEYSISGTTLTLTYKDQMYMFAKQKK